MHLPDHRIDDVLRFSVTTSDPSDSSETAATGNVVWRVYEDGVYMTRTGNMTAITAGGEVGMYSTAETLSAASGYEAGKNYTIRITATVAGVAVAESRDFRVVAGAYVSSMGADVITNAAIAADAIDTAQVKDAALTAAKFGATVLMTVNDIIDETLTAHVTADSVGVALKDILADTAVIGAAGAGLTDLGGMSTGMKAEVNAECDTALTDYDAATGTELAATEAKVDIIDTNVDAVQVVTDALTAAAAARLADRHRATWGGVVGAVVTTNGNFELTADASSEPLPAQNISTGWGRIITFVTGANEGEYRELDTWTVTGSKALTTVVFANTVAPGDVWEIT